MNVAIDMGSDSITSVEFAQIFHKSSWRRSVDAEILKLLSESNALSALVEDVRHHINIGAEIDSAAHSKRFRSFLLLSSAGCLQNPTDVALRCAAALELIHLSTLIIDDIQDDDLIRHDRPALWTMIGLPKAVNTACFMSFLAQTVLAKELRQNHSHQHRDQLILMIASLFSGQHADLSNLRTTSFEEYKTIVRGKTGALIEFACVLGAHLAGQANDFIILLRNFSQRMALLHQLNDDLQDLNTGIISWSDAPVANAVWCFKKNDRDVSVAITDLRASVEIEKLSLDACLIQMQQAGWGGGDRLAPLVLRRLLHAKY